MEGQSKETRSLEACCRGGQGPPRAVAQFEKKEGRTDCILCTCFCSLEKISKVKHNSKALFSCKGHIVAEAAGRHKLPHKIFKASIFDVLESYTTFCIFTGKCKLIVSCNLPGIL
jgi:hypothetical protein